MQLSRIIAVYFSPTGGTKALALGIAGGLARALGLPLEETDCTLPVARQGRHAFSTADLVVFATPVYAGRVPNKLLPYVQSGFQGNGALAVPVVAFGNRSFDNGLIELRNELEHNGFHTVAGAAFVNRHVFTGKLAAGRPDGQDRAVLAEFVQGAADKIAALEAPPPPVQVRGEDPVGPYYTPLGVDGKPAVFLKAKPRTAAERCTGCGRCAQVCPMGSIQAEPPWAAEGICIKCQACVKACPAGAKYFDDPAFLSHVAMLEQTYARRAEPEVFL